MNRRIQIFLVVIFINFCAFAQNQPANWYFGLQAGINFNTNPPSLLNNGSLLSTEGSASVSSAKGDLLFYTNGQIIWSNNHKPMLNGTGLLGNSNTTQSAVIIPKPSSKNIYYVFTLDDLGGPNGLSYSEVDIKGNGGLGIVTSNKNILLKNSLSEKLTAIRHSNGKDYWVLVHGNNNNKFYAYQITKDGVPNTAIESTVGSVHPNLLGTMGYMKFSPDGKKVACAVGGSGNFVEVFDFDDNTGELSNPMKLSYISSPYGIEFSPNSKMLYVSVNTSIFQYTLPKFVNSTLLSLSENELKSDAQVWGLQLGLDGKIYVCKQSNRLSVINNPNDNGGDEGFVDNILLLSNTAVQGLPNQPQHYFNENLISIENACANQKATFKVLLNEPDSIVWDFAGQANISSLTPQYVFTKSGSYKITAKVYTGNYEAVLTRTVVIEDLPVFSLGADTILCKGQYLSYNFSLADAKYLWNNGSTSHQRKITTPGIHYLNITANGCSLKDSVEVTYNFVNPSFVINNPEQCINGNSFNFTSTTNEVKEIMWFIDDAEFDTEPVTQTAFIKDGLYKIKLKATSTKGCIDSITKEILVKKSPNAAFTVTANNTCGKNNSYTFSNTTVFSEAHSFKFIIEGKTIENKPTVNWTFSDIGEHTVSLVVTTAEGCEEVFERKVTVYPSPNADFSVVTNSYCLANNSFTVTFNGKLRGFETLSWKIDDVPFSPSANVFTKSFTTIGLHKISAEISNTTGCKELIVKTIEVYENPVADFSTSPNKLSCLGKNDIEFTSLSTGSLPITNYLWNFGDNTSSTDVSPKKSFANQSQYGVLLTITNEAGCTNAISKTINTYEQPEITISTKTISTCENDNAFELSYSNTNSASQISKVTWSSSAGNAIPSQNPAPASFPSSGEFTLNLEVETVFGCKDNATTTVNVYPMPNGVLTVNSKTQCLNTNLFEVSAPKEHNGISNTNFIWDLAGTHTKNITGNKANFTYNTIGDYSISATITDVNGCSTQLSENLTVNPIPEFKITKAKGCVNTPLTLDIEGLSPFIVVNKWSWDLGNNTTANILSPTTKYNSAGNYNIQATATSNNGCTYTYNFDGGVEISPNPEVGFDYKRISWGFEETILEFEANSSIQPSRYTWNFGNGAISTNAVEKVNYKDAGYYNVSLVATSDKGCKGSVTRSVLIVPPFDAYVPSSFTPNNDGINDYFGMEGVEFIGSFEMGIFNRWGQEIFHSLDLNNQWDGRYNNTPMPGGMYTFAITITDAEGRPYEINGTIQLIR